MRPDFWPNTPDILAGPLRARPPAAFALRFVLAATLVPLYGHLLRLRAVRERARRRHQRGVPPLREVRAQGARLRTGAVARPAHPRRERDPARHPALWSLRDLRFHHSDNEQILAYTRGHVGRRPRPRGRQPRPPPRAGDVRAPRPRCPRPARTAATSSTTSSPATATRGRATPATSASTPPPARSPTCSTSAARARRPVCSLDVMPADRSG